MGLLTRTLRGAVRGAARTTGRALSRHVVPDTLIPSWKTQRRLSSIGSATSRGISKLARKAAKSKKKKPTKPGLWARTWATELAPGLRVVASHSTVARPTKTVSSWLARFAPTTPGPPATRSASRNALQNGPRSVRAQSTKPKLKVTPWRETRSLKEFATPRPEPVVRPQVPNEVKKGKDWAKINAWDRGDHMPTQPEFVDPPQYGPWPLRKPTLSLVEQKRRKQTASRKMRQNRVAATASRREKSKYRRSTSPRNAPPARSSYTVNYTPQERTKRNRRMGYADDFKYATEW